MNILVVRTDKLGDFITALPTLYVLKRHNPNNRIIACVAPLNRELAQACDFIDEVVVEKGGPFWELVGDLRAVNADVSVTLFSNTRMALAQFFARIPLRIAPATKIAQLFYNRRITQRRSQVKMAEFEYNLQLAKALFEDIELDFEKPLLRFEPQERAKIYDDFCAQYAVSRPVVAFHPGFGGSSDANWTADEYVELIRLAATQKRVQVVVTFGPGEEALHAEFERKLEGVDAVLYPSRGGIVAFAKLLASFRLFISTSTGTYHLAALVGTPTMTFFADTLFASAARWKSVSEDGIQKHYMIPLDQHGRDAFFIDVKRELVEELETIA